MPFISSNGEARNLQVGGHVTIFQFLGGHKLKNLKKFEDLPMNLHLCKRFSKFLVGLMPSRPLFWLRYWLVMRWKKPQKRLKRRKTPKRRRRTSIAWRTGLKRKTRTAKRRENQWTKAKTKTKVRERQKWEKRTPKTYSYEERVGISQEDNCGQRYQRRRRSRKGWFHYCSKRSRNGFL